MLTTDNTGAALSGLSYTAFGEPIGDPALLATRYQYAGGWGYETGRPTEEFPYSDLIALWGANVDLPPIVLLHVGHRWYDPSLGRFVQRDPIGLAGGLNLYAYCANDPLAWVDPTGRWSVWPGAVGVGVGAALAAR